MAPRFRGLPSPKNAIFPMENADSERLEGKPNGWGGEEEREERDGNGNSQPTPVPNAPGKKYAVRARPSLRLFIYGIIYNIHYYI